MMRVNADLHIHGRFSAATSRNISPENMSSGSRQKGVDILATGDILHPQWRGLFVGLEEVAEGTFLFDKTYFILEAEVEDVNRVHHLLLFPSVSAVEDFVERCGIQDDVKADGRPHLSLSGEAIAEAARGVDALIGPCHAFTPWTALYASHNSLEECYGSLSPYVGFFELGLSADTDYADRIGDLHRLTFLSNSDAHSTAPLRLAREFNGLEVQEPSFREVKKALLRQGGRKVVLNVGLPPQAGKYNESACIRCFRHVSLEDARRVGWKCTCGGRIKKGVKDRVEELACSEEPQHPYHRPPYIHIIPLQEIIAKALCVSPTSKKVMNMWSGLVEKFGTEVEVLTDNPLDEIKEISSEVAVAIGAFRDESIGFLPGGGGRYGEVVLPNQRRLEDVRCVEECCNKGGQTNIGQWF